MKIYRRAAKGAKECKGEKGEMTFPTLFQPFSFPSRPLLLACG